MPTHSTLDSKKPETAKSEALKTQASKTDLAKSLASKWNERGVKVRATPGPEGNSGAVARQGGQASQQVMIAGVPLRLKSSHDEETVNELVRMVDEKVSQALPLTKTGSIQNAAILAALNMAEELLLLKRQARELTDSLEARVSRVIDDLEKSSPTV
jgi:cell division protein ZapA